MIEPSCAATNDDNVCFTVVSTSYTHPTPKPRTYRVLEYIGCYNFNACLRKKMLQLINPILFTNFVLVSRFTLMSWLLLLLLEQRNSRPEPLERLNDGRWKLSFCSAYVPVNTTVLRHISYRYRYYIMSMFEVAVPVMVKSSSFLEVLTIPVLFFFR